MQFLKKNFIETTTSIVVNSNTGTVSNILDRDLTYQYLSSGFDDDTTTTTMTINFSETMTVSRIAIMGTNVKEFNIFYDGVTANTFALTSTSDTTTSQWSSNSETAMFLQFTAVDCTSVSFDFKATQEANNDKAVGYLLVSQEHITFDRIPNAFNYSPTLRPTNVVHNLSDGGTRIQTLDEKRYLRMAFNFIDDTFKAKLKSVYDLHEEIVFVAFGTTSSWDEQLFPCVWVNGFEFERFSDNAKNSGYSGSIEIKESSI